MRRTEGWLTSRGSDLPAMVSLVCISLFVHAANMFNSPAVFEDEGTYALQAWAVLRMHRLTPYTFTYDHGPGAWIVAAAWMLLTGGPRTFGGAIPSARVLMLILHVASVPLLYRLCRKLGCGPAAAWLATLVFTVSPLALAYQRAFVLDNVMVFWLLVSLNLLLDGWGRLSRLVLSGITFGLAVLSKETALFLFPAVAYIGYRQRWRHHGGFGLAAWVVPAFVTMSWYSLYAALKGELLPATSAFRFAVLSRGSPAKNSLVEAVRWQIARQGGNPFSLHNAFWQLARHDWIRKDPLLLGIGAAAVAFNLVRGVRNRRALAAGLLGLFPLLYLARGGVVFDFYVLFALPFLALNLGVAASVIPKRFPPAVAWVAALALAAVVVGAWWTTGRLHSYFQARAARVDRLAVAWVKRNVPPQSRMVVADNFWADLHEPGLWGPAFPNAHSHWKVVNDPAIRNGVFYNDWRRVDYLLTSTLNEGTFRATGNQVALNALSHAEIVKSWSSGPSLVRLWKVIGAGGSEHESLVQAGDYLSRTFGLEGAFVGRDGSVSSESESYALLRAVWSNDPATFNRVWGWTQAHLQRPDGLCSWLWKDNRVADVSTATDADADIAYALLVAGRRWASPALTEQGRRMAAAIWDKEVVSVKGQSYAVAGDWGAARQVLPLNPSYFSPFAYRVFAEADPSHPWFSLLDAGYKLLDSSSQALLGGRTTAGLPPDWVALDRTSGTLAPLALTGQNTTRYSYDAARSFWRVALDYRWTGDGRGAAFLRRAQFLDGEVGRKGAVSGAYAHDGTILEDHSSPVGTAGAVAALLTTDYPKADALYWRSVVGTAVRGAKGSYWGDPSDLYGQEWIWFAAAFYNNSIPNLWTHAPR
jgi:endo-1,4-beta-D-glucanase Y/4-amino-4-deoxy-L-arabinose transferase-like glycosyltransferase